MIRGRRITRTALLATVVSSAFALLVSGCSTPDSTSNQSGTTSGSTSGTLVVGVTSEADTLFPWKATQFQAVNVMQTLYGTLTEFDQDLNVVPGLAQSWEISTDGLTVTFHLRSGVTFHDGSVFDSADVKYSLDAIMDEATAAVSASSLASVTQVQTPDADTVVLTLSAPDAGLLANLAVINMAMLSSDSNEQDLSVTPNGTGPFRFQDRKANQSLTVARNDSYWGDEVKVGAVEFRVIPDETSIVSAMQSGNVQMAVFDDPLVAQTAQSSTITITKTPQLSYHVLQLNDRQGALTDVNLRLAMQCAIDRQQVLDTAAMGEGEVTGPITSPAYKSDPASRPCPTRDLNKAAEYLAKSAYPDGVTISTIVSQGEYSTSVNEAQNLKAQLADANINLDLEILESGAYVDRWIAADFEAAVALNGGRPDPDGMYSRYFTSTGNLNKVAGYSSDTLDTLFAQGRQTSDPSQRKAIYTKISNELEDQAVWIWMFTSYTYTATSGVQGFIPMANSSMQYLRAASLG